MYNQANQIKSFPECSTGIFLHLQGKEDRHNRDSIQCAASVGIVQPPQPAVDHTKIRQASVRQRILPAQIQQKRHQAYQ